MLEKRIILDIFPAANVIKPMSVQFHSQIHHQQDGNGKPISLSLQNKNLKPEGDIMVATSYIGANKTIEHSVSVQVGLDGDVKAPK